jgi:hypothetical protein
MRARERTLTVIRIRYKDLAPGLHGKAERGGRRTTIFLVPGLTSAQRKAALRRLRQEARRRCGPRLPVPQLTIALVADWLRVASRSIAAVIRLHPIGSILPMAAIGCLMVLFVLASVSARIIHRPEAAGPADVPMVSGSGTSAPGPGAVYRVSGPDPTDQGGSDGAVSSGAAGKLSRTLLTSSSGSGAGGTRPGSGASTGQGSGGGPGSGSGSGSGPGSGGGPGPISPGVSVGAGASAGGAVSAGVSASAGAGEVSADVAADVGGTGASVSVSARPSPSRSSSRSDSSGGVGVSVCVNIGPLAGCVHL